MPGLLASGSLIWLQPWSLESRLILLAAELFACLLIGVALHDHIARQKDMTKSTTLLLARCYMTQSKMKGAPVACSQSPE
jgi:hypothetical protein